MPNYQQQQFERRPTMVRRREIRRVIAGKAREQ